MLLFEDFDPEPGDDGPTRVPLARVPRRYLLVDLEAISDEAFRWVCRTTDPALAEFLSRVVLVVEQTRVHLRGRQP